MSKEEVTVDNLKKTLVLMGDAFSKEETEIFKGIIDSSGIKNFGEPKVFSLAITYSWNKFIKSFIKQEISQSKDIIFIYQNYSFIHRYLKDLFAKNEGGCCSADKSKKVINGLVEFFISGEEIKFDYTNKRAYNLPQKILTTHDEILFYYKGLESLYFGRPEVYIDNLKRILKGE